VSPLVVWLVVILLAIPIAIVMVRRLADRWESAVPLAVFRIAYGAVLLCEVGQMVYYERLISDPVPYLVPGEVQLTYLLVVWMIAIVCVILGLFTKTAALTSYLAGLCTLSIFHDFEYHVDYIMTAMNLLLVVAPVGQRLSLDALRARLAAAQTGQPEPPTEVSALYRKLFVLFGIAFVYFDSVWWKFVSPMWTNGLGVWMPATQPQVTWYDYSLILDREWFIKGLGYTTLVLETAFLFLMWFDVFAVPLAVVGLGLHLGITAVFPIPWFGLGVAAIYLLVLPPSLYRWIGRQLAVDRPRLTFYYDEACSVCNRTRIVLEHFDLRGALAFRGVRRDAAAEPALRDLPLTTLLADVHAVDRDGRVYRGLDTYRQVAINVVPFAPLGWLLALPGVRQVASWCYRRVADARMTRACETGTCGLPLAELRLGRVGNVPQPLSRAVRVGLVTLIALALVCQVAATVQAPLVARLARAVGLPGTGQQLAAQGKRITRGFSQPLMGVTPHPVFMDYHFGGYNHLVTIVYVGPDGHEIWLPLLRPPGHAHWMNSGRVWVFWNWRCVGPRVNIDRLTLGVKRETAFWMHRHGISPRDATFRVLVKRTDVPQRWEAGSLRRQQEKPWTEAGIATWKNGQFAASLRNVEGL